MQAQVVKKKKEKVFNCSKVVCIIVYHAGW